MFRVVNSKDTRNKSNNEQNTAGGQSTDCCSVNYATNIVDPQGPWGTWISLVLCVISISIDPLFFYLPVRHKEHDHMDLDKKLGITAVVLRSAIDLIYVIYINFQSRTRDNKSTPCYWMFDLCISYRSEKRYIDLLAVLPLPQVVVLVIVSEMEIASYYNAMNVLKYFVYLLFVPRVIRIYPLFKKATGIFGVLGEVTWAKAAFNLYLYMLSGHVFGALWYFYSIQRALQFCNKLEGCNFEQHSFSEDLSTLLRNNDFGIYKEVIEFNVTKGDFPPRFMYCFRWGLLSLSCFGQNLKTSTYIWENVFTILITIASLLLFVFLIGNMQLYLQSETTRSEEMKLKVREIEQWKPFKELREELRLKVRKHHQHVWQKTKGTDVEESLNNLPKGIRRTIKEELCLKLLKQVPLFATMCDQHLNAMCERLKHVLHPDETCIIRTGDPIDEMLFIMHDVNGPHSKLLVNDDKDNPRYFCGDELTSWALDPNPSSDLPISTKNICTNGAVEAFALTADDLKEVFTKFNQCYPKHPSRCYSLMWRNWAAAYNIQVAWRHYRVKKLEKRRREEEKSLSSSFSVTICAS